MSPIRILHLIDTLERGGAEQSLLEITARMDRTRFQPMVCAVYGGDALRPQFEAAGVTVHPLGLSAKYGFVRAARQVRRLVRQLEPAVLHTSLFRAGQTGRFVGRSLGIPIISSWTGTPYSQARRRWDPAAQSWKLPALRLLDMFTARWVTRFHSVSAAVAEENQRALRVSPDRVSVVYRGRDLERLDAVSREEIQAVRQELSLGEPAGVSPGVEEFEIARRQSSLGTRSPVLLNVGRLVPPKGQLQLLQMMRQLRERLPQAVLLVAGDGPEKKVLADEIVAARLQDHVRLLGTRRDVPALLKASDVFVFPSHYEGLPGALVEAMLAGLPIVASDIPMHREFLEHERSALLVDSPSPSEMAAAVGRLAGDRGLAASLADEACRRARRLFDIRTVVRQMEELFAAVAARRGRSA